MFCKSLSTQIKRKVVDGRWMGIHRCRLHGCNCTPNGEVLPHDVECADGFRICGERCREFEELHPPNEKTHFNRQRGMIEKSPTVGPMLTIGIPHFRDFSGLWATVQSLLFYHGEAAKECELIVIDNDPAGNPAGDPQKDHSAAAARLCRDIGAGYVHFTNTQGTAAAKGRVFEIAQAPAVLIMDCHVMLPSGVLRRLLDLFADNPESKDLYSGPYILESGTVYATHMVQRWFGGMFGGWGVDHRVLSNTPFQIDSHGCGLFACNKHAWPGFHPLLRGFGPEEGHLHDRIRRNGGVCWSLPWLSWHHRSFNPDRSRPENFNTAELVRGYTICAMDTGTIDIDAMRAHYVDKNNWINGDEFDAIVGKTRLEFSEFMSQQPADCA